jgi:hypothetical protein
MKKMGCAKCGGSMKKGGPVRMKKMAEGGTAKRNISKPGAGFAPATKGGANVGMNIYGIPNAGQTGPNRRVTTETMKLGGSFAPKGKFNRKVQASCKDGKVTDYDGRCVMARKMATGGSSMPDFSKDGKITQKDVLMGRGVIPKAKKGGNWIQGAIKKPGALRESLGVKKGETIPKGKLAAAAKKGGKLGQRARLAMTLSKMRKG